MQQTPVLQSSRYHVRSRKQKTDPVPPVLAAAVRAAVDRVISSADFRASQRNRDFLRYIVEAELEGRGHEVNAYVIGSRIFGRGGKFDHVNDPIVRIEASKLRRELEHYYLTGGRGESIAIHLPKGAYRPTFEQREADRADAPGADVPPLDPAGITVASLRLGEGPLAAMQPPLRAQIADALTRSGDSAVYVNGEEDAVLLASDAVRRIARENGTALVLSGDAWHEAGHHRIVIRLHDGATGRQLWSEEFPQDAASVVARIISRVAEARKHLAATDRVGDGN